MNIYVTFMAAAVAPGITMKEMFGAQRRHAWLRLTKPKHGFTRLIWDRTPTETSASSGGGISVAQTSPPQLREPGFDATAAVK